MRAKAAYEGEGKTTVHFLYSKTLHMVFYGTITTLKSSYGFKLNNGLTVLGPMAIFPRTVLSWQVPDSYAITEESLRFLKLLEPKIDLVIMGLETNERSVVNSVLRVAQASNLNVEILATEHACPTFNFLNAEGRSIAAVLIPPVIIDNMSENDMLQTKLHYQDVFNKSLN
ncbi:hypothetical protein K1T71_001017 [Dendrolimus kikuchii]|uniref:Uncharacterized protein n=1 Tax=Dendrolimus kikuchii TaxID=765133 RepID=A0ACC1DGM1_9NEOP|nr:hypothetical protein K1T71_001017 [Dendrolimus kikuchii]